MNSLRFPFLAICLLLTAIPCLGQRGGGGPSVGVPMRTSIRGSVRDAVTHQAIARVVVMVEASEGGYATQAETDSSGHFDLQGVGAGSYAIHIRQPGYLESTQYVDLTTDPMAYLMFELRPKPGSGPPAVAPEGPDAKLNARLASVPDKAKKEFSKAQELWLQGKDLQGCVDLLNKAIKDYPKFADAYVLLATADMQMNNPADAKSALNKAIEIDPKLPDARFTMGKIQNREKDYAGAEQSLTEALKLDDSSAEGHYELGKTYLAEGKVADADAQGQKAVALQPGLAPAHILLGNVAWKRQDAEGALKEYQQYLKLDPSGPMAPGAQALVKRIQDAMATDAKQQ